MNIGFDMSFAITTSFQRGVGRYSRNLIEGLGNQDEQHTFYFFYPDFEMDLCTLQDQLQRFLTENHIDLFFVLSPFEYFWHHTRKYIPLLKKEWFGPAKLAVLLYDFWPLSSKGLLDEASVHDYLRIVEFCKSCDAVFAISESTKADAVRLAGFTGDQIHVIMGGLEEHFKPLNKIEMSGIPTKYGLLKPFILYVGGIELNKNIVGMFQSVAEANRQLGYRYQFVICSKLKEPQKEQLREYAQTYGVGDHLVLTDYVSDEELVQLYNAASMFLYPSFHEGLGFPVIEAMACGTPVITSNNSSLSEIGKDCALLVNPHNNVETIEAILKMTNNPDLRRELIQAGCQRAALFSWKEVAAKVNRVITKVARKNIAIFSPLPPVSSPAAELTANLLPELLKYYDCDIYVNDGYAPDIPDIVDGRLQIHPHHVFTTNVTKYDAIIYHLHNSPDHVYMLAHLNNTNGVSVLHETNLHGLAAAWTLEQNDLEQYYNILEEEAEEKAPALLDAVYLDQRPASRNRTPIVRFFLNRSNSAVVHDQTAKNLFQEAGYLNIFLAPSPADPNSYTATQYVAELRKAIRGAEKVKSSKNIRFWKPSVPTKRTNSVRLKPDRLLRMKRRGKYVTYLSFDLSGLPAGESVSQAVMHLPFTKRKAALKVHRIRRPWDKKKAKKKPPKIEKKYLFKKRGRRSGVDWDCTSIARRWAQKRRKNYGIYVNGKIKPVLHVHLKQ